MKLFGHEVRAYLEALGEARRKRAAGGSPDLSVLVYCPGCQTEIDEREILCHGERAPGSGLRRCPLGLLARDLCEGRIKTRLDPDAVYVRDEDAPRRRSALSLAPLPEAPALAAPSGVWPVATPRRGRSTKKAKATG